MTQSSDGDRSTVVLSEESNGAEETVDFTYTYEDLHSLANHKVNGNPLYPPYPYNMQVIYLGMGCFWGAERLFWETKGVFVTMVGFMGGHLDKPTYEDVCSGESGHTETVKVVYDPELLSVDDIISLFVENSTILADISKHSDENEPKTRRVQYASKVWCSSESQLAEVKQCLKESLNLQEESDDDELLLSGFTTLVQSDFYPAEDRHQQYMAGRKMKRPVQCPRR